MAARELRYKWFEEIRQKNKYELIAVAHHQDDEIETFFINLIRGTGIAGLHGIKAKAGKVVRPLLFTGRKEIEEFAAKNKLKFREDSSNKSVKYLRNRIRLQLIPLLKDLNPLIETTIKEDIQKLRQAGEVLLDLVEEKRQEVMSTMGDVEKLDIQKLLSLKNRSYFLFEFLQPFGFSGDIIEKISKSLKTTEGKQFFSSTHRLAKDRDFLILSPLHINKTEQTYTIEEDCKESKGEVHLKFKTVNVKAGFEIAKENNRAMFDLDKINFPLTIRKWKAGDHFYPYGMKGKKKLSDFFTDIKLSLIEKENIWLLCNNNDIIWVIGHRTDNRYKVSRETRKVYVAEII
jgi:tRNA(Ile)-lysidine synthase